MNTSRNIKTVFLLVCALLAFAGNSVLCRITLDNSLMGAVEFTLVRLFSGAVTLVVLSVFLMRKESGLKQLFKPRIRTIKGSLLLLIYALFFSYAYVVLETGSGALILFGSVQLTMLFINIIRGNRPIVITVVGMVLAFSGLVYWLIPAWGTPSIMGFVLMACSGVAWGLYTLAGQGTKNALLETTQNFIFTLPWLIIIGGLLSSAVKWQQAGIVFAVISGAITSGIGYAIWYAVLPKITVSQAGVIQLLVPIIAAVGGVVFAGESMTLRLFISAVMVLGGIYLVMHTPRTTPSKVAAIKKN